ncbi:MAG: 16S rRNA (cytidine(1402)-2'-O)-methyltransferase [Candidatus Melainabacteria bacterium GWF2_32_7]|nr:MAG: 16S rRNA (cytidine(1402)-2'-O)-methyltransferase [Candidatus Melainabacteria bacterium GWF2_32_7]
MQNKGVLYICPTPIGNLEDITLRALRILKEVDFIACEDTRVTIKLLNHYNIATKLISYHKFSEKQKGEYIINLIKEGKNIALVSDAGTPLLSDPGFELVKLAYTNQIKVEPLPGPSALMTAISASYLEKPYFAFLGFLPRSKKEKESLLTKYQEINIVVYEAPSRLVKTLEELLDIFGNKTVTVARELTKIHEEIKRDTLENHIKYYTNKPPKGEITMIIEGEEKEKGFIEEAELFDKIKILIKEGYSSKDISKIISTFTPYSKSYIYDLVIKSLSG